MTRINKTKQDQRTGMNIKARKNRINQIISEGINRAVDQDGQFILRMVYPIGDYRGYLAVFNSYAI